MTYYQDQDPDRIRRFSPIEWKYDKTTHEPISVFCNACGWGVDYRAIESVNVRGLRLTESAWAHVRKAHTPTQQDLELPEVNDQANLPDLPDVESFDDIQALLHADFERACTFWRAHNIADQINARLRNQRDRNEEVSR